MKALLQRVTWAKVEVNNRVVGEINSGILVLLGVEKDDTEEKAKRLAQRVTNYRMFSDDNGKMNLNVSQINGACLVVSQFTLVADTQKGNRPSFSCAAGHELSEHLYQVFMASIKAYGVSCESGQFAADMQVSLTNDGPVTFALEC